MFAFFNQHYRNRFHCLCELVVQDDLISYFTFQNIAAHLMSSGILKSMI